MRVLALALGSAIAIACGGTTGNDLFADAGGSGNDGSSKADGSNTTDSGTVKDGGGTLPDGAPDCTALSAQLDALRKKANACSGGSANVCGKTISDFCCPLTVTNPDSPDSKAFETARDNFKNLCGAPVCPGAPCPPAPSNACGSTGQCG